MEDKNCLSKEQMFELEDLGVDISKASMCIMEAPNHLTCRTNVVVEFMDGLQRYSDYITKTFSVTNLIEMMPAQIEVDYDTCYLQIEKRTFDDVTEYRCRYCSCDDECGVILNRASSMIDAIYETFVELVKKGLLKTENQ